MEKAFSQQGARRERMNKQRKHYAPEEKVATLRRHLLENEPISKLCEEIGLQPSLLPLAEGVLRERRLRLHVRLNSATGYITPKDMLAGRQQEIHAERVRKEQARRLNVRFAHQDLTDHFACTATRRRTSSKKFSASIT
jgi:hypothetical protein